MLPGLRFLFVATVLSMSMLIFGLGAAALLRSAHEEFSSLPSRRAQPETVFAQPIEPAPPTLAMLRVDAPVTDAESSTAPAQQLSPNASTVGDTNAAEPDTMAADPDRPAALTAAMPAQENSSPAETPQAETAATADTAAVPPEAQVAAIPQPTSPEPTEAAGPVATDPGAEAASARIATLGGPAVTIESKAASKTPVATSSKRAQTRHRARRRRIVRPQIVPAKPITLGLFEPLPVVDRPILQD